MQRAASGERRAASKELQAFPYSSLRAPRSPLSARCSVLLRQACVSAGTGSAGRRQSARRNRTAACFAQACCPIGVALWKPTLVEGFPLHRDLRGVHTHRPSRHRRSRCGRADGSGSCRWQHPTPAGRGVMDCGAACSSSKRAVCRKSSGRARAWVARDSCGYDPDVAG